MQGLLCIRFPFYLVAHNPLRVMMIIYLLATIIYKISISVVIRLWISRIRSCGYALSNACARSAMMSSTFSMPTDKRIISGVTPADFCCSSFNCACVVDAG